MSDHVSNIISQKPKFKAIVPVVASRQARKTSLWSNCHYSDQIFAHLHNKWQNRLTILKVNKAHQLSKQIHEKHHFKSHYTLNKSGTNITAFSNDTKENTPVYQHNNSSGTMSQVYIPQAPSMKGKSVKCKMYTWIMLSMQTSSYIQGGQKVRSQTNGRNAAKS